MSRYWIRLACFIILILLSDNRVVIGQDLSLKGYIDSYLNPLGQRTINQVYSRCFDGLGLYSCTATYPTDYQELMNSLPYYLSINSISGTQYCLQCCGTPPSNIDIWELTCPVTTPAVASAVNLYGYVMRFARNAFQGDSVVIECPIRRSACSYDSNGQTISCNRANDTSFLAGYTLTLDVVQYNVNFKYWRGVSACSLETYETNETLSGKSFSEKIIMRHIPPKIPPWDYSKIGFFSFFLIILVYAILYFCRNKHCPYCGNKLVLSRNLCYKCRWVGAKEPDPVLIQALEEKRLSLQGQMPEKFPGIRFCVGFLRGLFIMVCCSCRRKVKVAPNKYEMMLKELEANPVELVESKIQNIEEDTKSIKYKKKKYKNNPNILEYEAQLIYEAVQHPKFIKDDNLYDVNNKNIKPAKKSDKPSSEV